MAALLTTARALGRLARPGGSLVSRPAAARLLSAAAALRVDSKPLQYTVNVTESGRGVYEEVVNVRDKHQFSVDEPTSMTGVWGRTLPQQHTCERLRPLTLPSSILPDRRDRQGAKPL